ncbi:MAG: hotdog fold domain-containing protein [Chloroflexota bacterium]
MSQPSLLSTWERMSKWAGGKWVFSQLVCWKAPYFGSIRPRFVELRPGYCEVRIQKRWAVLNHIGTVHAIAMCNMAEIAGGIMTDVTIPTTHRWIPKGMSVEYLKKAGTNLRAVAELTPIPAFGEGADLPVTINILDAKGQVVCRAVITMWVSPKKG